MNWRQPVYRAGRALQGDGRFARLAELRSSEGWSRERLQAEHDARLSALLIHAYEHVPYYREPLRQSGVVTGGKAPRADLSRFSRLPLLTRAIVREQAQALQDERPPSPGNPRFHRTSGGTTGEPVRIVHDRRTHEAFAAVTFWFDEWSGYALGQPRVVLWSIRPRRFHRVLADRAAAFLKNETILPVGLLSDGVVDGYLARIDRVRPVQILGFAGAVHEVARRAEARGLAPAPPRAVMVSGETLLPDWRVTIERAFRAPLFNRYGTVEVGGIACECARARRLHVSWLTHHVEVIGTDGRPVEDGESGEIVVTLLTNRAMPLIRYRVGDVGAYASTPGPCACGRSLPSLAGVAGRTLESFHRADGSLVHAVSLARALRFAPWARRLQLVQPAVDRVVVRLVDAERAFDPATTRRRDLEAIRAHIRRLMGDACMVEFEFVDDIPREASGKFRLTARLMSEPSPPGSTSCRPTGPV